MSFDILFQALSLFAPILAANQGAGLARALHLPFGDIPVSVRLLGPNKTVAAFYMGPICAMAILLLYSDPYWFVEGLVLGGGAILGEQLKSALKRWLDMRPGAPWTLDRIDFAIGGAVAAKLYFAWVTWEHVFWIILVALPVHIIGNKVSYTLGLRKTPH